MDFSSGFLLIDKPQGITSSQLVGKIKFQLRSAGIIDKSTKIGHGGTLDPMATGLLVVLLGRATRLADLALHTSKTYSGTIRLGFSTDTDDITGERIGEIATVPALDSEALKKIAAKFSGIQKQRPPIFSALKIGGKRAYDLARAGDPVELKEREINVTRCELESVDLTTLKFVIESSGGTYIRSLARDIGAAIGCGATLASLRREGSSGLSVGRAQPWLESETWARSVVIHPWWNLLPQAPIINVESSICEDLARGDQRRLNQLPLSNHLIKRHILYAVNDVPRGVVTAGERGLELMVHIGNKA